MSARITTQNFLGLTPTGDHTASLTMTEQLLGGGSGSLFGGVGIAAAAIELERITGQSPAYISCQFASTVVPPSVLEFTTEILTKGRTVSQTRITATSDGRTILAMIGATSDRAEQHRARWSEMPVTTAPEELETMSFERFFDGRSDTLHNHVDIRMASGLFGFSPEGATARGTASGDGSTLFWARMPGVAHDAAALGMIADYLPSAVGNAMNTRMHCSSLDNTVRFVEPIEADASSDWVLCESHVEFVAAGLAVNRGFLWSRDGRLLVSANQSMTASTPRE